MKHLASLLLLVAVTAPYCVNAGMTVTDPTSYTYYMKQLKEAQNQLKKLQEQIKIAEDTKKTVTTMADDITGAYNRARGVVNDLKKVKGIISQPDRIFSDAKKIMDMVDDPEAMFKEVDINLDNIFVDISHPDVNPWMVQRKKQAEVQKIFKDALRSSEIELAKLPARMDAIEALAAQIDKTENIKDSQDLTNRLITELIIGQERMISLLSQLAQAEVAAEYTGYNEETDGAFRERSHLKSESKKSAFSKFVRENDAVADAERPLSDLIGL